MTKKKLLSLLLIIAVFVSFPVYSKFNNSQKKWTLIDFQNQELKWQNCYGNFECSTLLVPVDYDKITNDVFHLKVIKFKATDQRQKLGALIVNPGGPGASAFDYAYNAENIVSAAIREKYDIVGFDQRGVGQSDPIRCLTDKETDEMLAGPMIADSPENQRKMIENATFFASKCKKAAGNKLTHLSTLESAKDMELLRLALDEPKLNYLGKSYGTYLGTLYASLYPTQIGKMILDGAIDPTISITEQNLNQAKGFESQLNEFLTAYEFNKKLVLKLISNLSTNPINTNSNRKLTESLAIIGIASALYDDASGWFRLDKALNQAILGNGSLMLAMSDEYYGRHTSGKYLSNENDVAEIINCLDWPARILFNELESTTSKFLAAAPIFGPFLVYSQLVCNYFEPSSIKMNRILSLKIKNPVMVVGTTRDPATPYQSAIALSKIFTNSILVTLDASGHTGQNRGDLCVDNAVEEYLLNSLHSNSPQFCHPIGK